MLHSREDNNFAICFLTDLLNVCTKAKFISIRTPTDSVKELQFNFFIVCASCVFLAFEARHSVWNLSLFAVRKLFLYQSHIYNLSLVV